MAMLGVDDSAYRQIWISLSQLARSEGQQPHCTVQNSNEQGEFLFWLWSTIIITNAIM